jgi:hypothetical protein
MIRLHQSEEKDDMKNIEFTLIDEQYMWMDKPVPAITHIPEWYRNMSSFKDNEKKLRVGGRATNQTIKRCIPFMEAMTAGYYITLPADVMVSKADDGTSQINWLTNVDFITTHDVFQTAEFPIPNEYEFLPFKFMNFFLIKTPPGYSSLFVHPLNRPDLPFMSFSGFVDTDTHDVGIHFPFLLRKDFEGVIEKGTPIIQVIPIKRDEWQSDVSKTAKASESFAKIEKYFSYVTRAYKKLAWHRKIYK